MNVVKYLILIWVVCPLWIHAGNNSSQGRFYYGVFLSPGLDHTILLTSKENTYSKLYFALSGGMEAGYRLNEQFALKSGLGYCRRTFGLEQRHVIFPDDIDPNTHIITESVVETKFIFSELQLPLEIQYGFDKNNYFVSAGFKAILPFSGHFKNVIHKENGSVKSNQGTPVKSRLLIAPTMGFGFLLKKTENYSVFLEPTVSFYLSEYGLNNTKFCDAAIRMSLLFNK